MVVRTKPPEEPQSSLASSRRRIVLVDDHVLVRESLSELMNQEPDLVIVGQASDGKEAAELCASLKPDAIVLDLTRPEGVAVLLAQPIRVVL